MVPKAVSDINHSEIIDDNCGKLGESTANGREVGNRGWESEEREKEGRETGG
jgi:hypothetical protein